MGPVYDYDVNDGIDGLDTPPCCIATMYTRTGLRSWG